MPYKDRQKQLQYLKTWYEQRRKETIEALGGRCFLCGSRLDLEIHHIYKVDFVGSRHNAWGKKEKLMLLCKECHKEEHRKLGRGYHGKS